MLRVTKEQFEAFSKQLLKSFEDRMVGHLWEFFPNRCKKIGDEQVRNTVHQGISRAASHGFVSERHVARYIDVMFFLGLDFDTSHESPWVANILARHNLTQEEKLQRLHDRALAELGREEDLKT
ncbi:hypothetical protein [Archangium sp.]|uniref:hypothetical protein n=1 Tax=Archangium sp. TaxID=1872627 RepID=UPI002D6D56A3|nr:hypothetical protein [Archangium sp.]HYO53139.1 hypothetical protein [Archangium sp.]